MPMLWMTMMMMLSCTGGIREFTGKVTVAVKQSRLEISLADIKDFFSEVEIMKKFSKPHHKNVRPCTV